ncbi:MAG: hypothetical protein PUE63_00770 [Lachnospiraceae bacterium]|nr:hypothetical protein [Lachnospiraceae bacterium]
MAESICRTKNEGIVLQKSQQKSSVEILSAFLRSVPALIRYGRTKIYEADTFYTPYRLEQYRISETGEVYCLICSYVSEDIAIFSECTGKIRQFSKHIPSEYRIHSIRSDRVVHDEIRNQMQLDHAIRKALSGYHLDQVAAHTVFLPEQVFYARGKDTYIFAVDLFQGKVDFRNLDAIQKRIASNFLAMHPDLRTG